MGIEEQVRTVSSAQLLVEIDEKLSDLNIALGNIVRNCGPEAAHIVKQMKNNVYPILCKVREVKRRHALAVRKVT